MKSALSLTFVASLMGSALPVAAQDGMELTSAAIRQAILREAARMAADHSGAEAVPGSYCSW